MLTNVNRKKISGVGVRRSIIINIFAIAYNGG